MSTGKKFPSLSYHRGAKRRVGRYFGPFPNASAVHQTLHAIQKIFPVRQCAESVFNHRSRPCLQYQIKRCSGPCVDGLVTKEEYDEDVANTIAFLEGKSFEVIENLGHKMQSASDAFEFEAAAVYRDKISALRAIQSQHLINQPGSKDTDVVAMAEEANQVCVSIMMYRGGNLWGSQNYFPKTGGQEVDADEVITAFISQHYSDLPVPQLLLVSEALEDKTALESWLSQRRQEAKASGKVKIRQANSQTEKA